MQYFEITVPDMNDSVSRVTLADTFYRVRFTYNCGSDSWSFGLYTDQDVPIALGIRIIPGMPMNLFFGAAELPNGVFGCLTKLDHVGRDAFKEGKAKFVFIPADNTTEE